MKPASSERRPIHHSPIFWIGVVLCLAAIAIYLWSNDLSWRPAPVPRWRTGPALLLSQRALLARCQPTAGCGQSPIGTFGICRALCSMSEFGGILEVGFRGHQDRFWPIGHLSARRTISESVGH